MNKLSRTTAAVLAPVVVLSLGAVPSYAASHREAPLTAAEPQIDSTDLYAFVSPSDPDTVTLISNWIPFEVPAGGPNFYPWANDVRYDIKIDNDHDARPDLIYRWEFNEHVRNQNTFLYNTGPVTDLNDETLNMYQTYTLTEIDLENRDRRVLKRSKVAAPSFVGDESMPDYAQLRDEAIRPVLNGRGKVFVGQADDSFFLDLRVFDLLYGRDLSETGNDTLDGFNVNTLALQLPKSVLARNGKAGNNPIIGVWTTAQRRTVRTLVNGGQRFSGRFRQVSRLGMPLVNEVVAPIGAKDLFSSSHPTGDAAFLPVVRNPEVPRLLEAIYGIEAPPTPRGDLVSVFLTGVEGLNKPNRVRASEQLRLNMSIAPNPTPNRMGVLAGDNAGFPNGRRLTDDVIDITLQVAAGELVGSPNDLGDAVDANDVPFDDTFPYIAIPHSGSTAPFGAESAPQGTAGEDEVAVAATTGEEMPLNGVAPLLLALGLVALAARSMRRGQTVKSNDR